MKKVIKKNYKFILGIVIGLIWSSGIAYAATILFDSDEVSYDNTTSGLSATNVQSALDELYVESTSYQLFESRVSTLESQVYPVGSVYISTTKSTTAQVKALFGGTWEAIGQGRVLVGAGTGTDSNSTSQTFSVNGTGGEYTHQLTIDEMPNHTHKYRQVVYTHASSSGYSGDGRFAITSSVAGNAIADWKLDTTEAGSSYYHNNIQPYLVVYMYKRTA